MKGSPPWYPLNYHSDPHNGQDSGVTTHFSGSIKTSANAGILLISGLQPEDEAGISAWLSTTGILAATHTVREAG